MDGSPHVWFENRAPKCCLLGFIDDATSKIMHLKFVHAETTSNYFLALKEYMLKHGKPKCYYSDRFSGFRINNDKEGYRKQGLTEEPGYSLRRAKVSVIETVKGEIKIEYQGKDLSYKKLLMKDHQGRIMNKKEILMSGVFPLGGKAI